MIRIVDSESGIGLSANSASSGRGARISLYSRIVALTRKVFGRDMSPVEVVRTVIKGT